MFKDKKGSNTKIEYAKLNNNPIYLFFTIPVLLFGTIEHILAVQSDEAVIT